MKRGATWFTVDFLPRWLTRAATPQGAVVESLNLAGQPDHAPATTLTQARLVYALSHLYLLTQDPRFLQAAKTIYARFDAMLRDSSGGYWQSTQNKNRRSYDQSFALLALITLQKADLNAVSADRVADLWHFIATDLTEPATGALWEDDRMGANGPEHKDLRAQNPQMHMLEAVLQAYEFTGETVWLERSAHIVDLVQRHFIDPQTGAIREFVGPDLAPIASYQGKRREPGHQYEWAWLLHRFADLGGPADARLLADRMIAFVETYGLRVDGPMAGAPFDALDDIGQVSEPTHLLWPLTEAGKFYAASGDAAKAQTMETLIFQRFFTEGPAPTYANQLDENGQILWPTALSRLIYHVALFVTEGARAGLWPVTRP